MAVWYSDLLSCCAQYDKGLVQLMTEMAKLSLNERLTKTDKGLISNLMSLILCVSISIAWLCLLKFPYTFLTHHFHVNQRIQTQINYISTANCHKLPEWSMIQNSYLLIICKWQVKETPGIIKTCEQDVFLPSTISITSRDSLLTFLQKNKVPHFSYDIPRTQLVCDKLPLDFCHMFLIWIGVNLYCLSTNWRTQLDFVQSKH
jgi:hypothetical protein